MQSFCGSNKIFYFYSEKCSPARIVSRFDISAMHLHDSIAHGETKAGPLSHRLCGEKG
jgi:hypothetical protein